MAGVAALARLVLQAGGSSGSCPSDIPDALTNGSMYDAVSCTFTEPAGTTLAATLLFASIGIPMYIYSDSAALPTVLLLIIGGAFLSLLSGGALQIIGVVLLLVGTVSLWLVVNGLREP